MKSVAVLLVAGLVGCATPTVKHEMSNIPPELAEKCHTLNLLPVEESRLSEIFKSVVSNYALYHECATKHTGVVEWYNKQKKIHDEVFNK